MIWVEVAVDRPLARTFTYRLAEDLGEEAIGRLVRVPFGRREVIGLIVALAEAPELSDEKIKDATLITAPRLPPAWLDLVRFAAEYYQHPLGEVAAFALPPLLRAGRMPRPRKERAGAAVPPPPSVTLNAAQADAVAAIVSAQGFQPFLLQGVTGSGKTEVYLEAIAAVLAQGGQVLMLVPEIALTPQLVARVAARFPDRHWVVATSGETPASRTRAFFDALTGRADIVLGTRLAVFMPLPRLSLVIVDEEHDPSFKQQEGFFFSARDLAVWRARQSQAPIVLGSATPSLESYHHAESGRYRRLLLPERANAADLPSVRLIDTRRMKLTDGLSQPLIEALAETLARGRQSLVFLNRRGYAPVLACPACGWISGCTRCAANLVLHLAEKRLICHHCGLARPIPPHCPSCGNLDLTPFGRGTQRVEARLSALFPQARILRIDRDSANTPRQWQAMLSRIHTGEADILVGTQMLAKGHDFPHLALVGVIGADASLFAADFRASERLFAQLMQVAGRAGRREEAGIVLVQTEHPGHPLYRALALHDYDAYARHLLAERRAANFPPFSHQAVLRADAPTLDSALAFLQDAQAAAPIVEGVVVYEPVPMRLMRLKGRERAQLLVEAGHRRLLSVFLSRWRERLEALARRALRWHLDVDPVEL